MDQAILNALELFDNLVEEKKIKMMGKSLIRSWLYISKKIKR